MFHSVKPLSKYLLQKSVRIYDAIFTLHAKCTCALLLVCTFLLSSKQYFGDPIICKSDMKTDSDFVNSYCWTLGTYVFPTQPELKTENYNETMENIHDTNVQYNIDLIYPRSSTEKRVFLRYYQWVVIVLLLQSFVFYLPAFLWKIWEGGRLKSLCSNLNESMTSGSSANIKKLANYFAMDYKETHLRYFLSYIFCEVLNFVISIANMLLLNVFLDGFWSHYVKVLGSVHLYNWNTWDRVTSNIFPKIAKCEIVKFGFSGSMESYDCLCLLPLNILNEKIFAVLWVWFILMAVLAGAKLLYRLVTTFNRDVRLMLLRSQARFIPKTSMLLALRGFSCGDWFLLTRVSNNMSVEQFRQLLELLLEQKRITSKNNSSLDGA
ncbi:zpg [Drosophila busckii]|uniref:Innexin n=1 Tax=Drosophila busckii TaxID=30019 RepID=A0A0M4ECP9_DROBS|nr:innexin inx4 [Drosophila busckii]ALC43234.1 zpg [Drosophila busckii]